MTIQADKWETRETEAQRIVRERAKADAYARMARHAAERTEALLSGEDW